MKNTGLHVMSKEKKIAKLEAKKKELEIIHMSTSLVSEISVHISEDGKTCKIEFPVFMRSVTHLKRALDLLLEDEEKTQTLLKEKFNDIDYKPEYKIPTMIALRSVLEKEIELNKLKLI